jgi:hypothetical protein
MFSDIVVPLILFLVLPYIALSGPYLRHCPIFKSFVPLFYKGMLGRTFVLYVSVPDVDVESIKHPGLPQ